MIFLGPGDLFEIKSGNLLVALTFWLSCFKIVQAISKKSFVPNSLWEANVRSSKLGTRSERVGSERSKEILEYVCG